MIVKYVTVIISNILIVIVLETNSIVKVHAVEKSVLINAVNVVQKMIVISFQMVSVIVMVMLKIVPVNAEVQRSWMNVMSVVDQVH